MALVGLSQSNLFRVIETGCLRAVGGHGIPSTQERLSSSFYGRVVLKGTANKLLTSTRSSVGYVRTGVVQASLDQQAGEPSQQELIQQAYEKLAEQDLASSVEKYKLEDEIFAEIDYAQVNAFTETAFAGNPAAIVYLPLERDAEWMQLVAREFNLSETAFLVRRREKKGGQKKKGKALLEANEDGTGVKPVKATIGRQPLTGNEFDLRWFTPKGEVRLCGHATLASAHLIFSTGLVEADNLLFHTKSGVLKARKVPEEEQEPATASSSSSSSGGGGDSKEEEGGGDRGLKELEQKRQEEDRESATVKRRTQRRSLIELEFPAEPAAPSVADRNLVREALGGAEVTYVGRSSLNDVLVEVADEQALRDLQPDITKLATVVARGVCVTARADAGRPYDFASRFFAPQHGISEDPVTGSAHCTLGPYWAEKLGKTSLRAFQASERGGHLEVTVDSENGKVYLRGCCVMVMAGVLLNTATLAPK